MFTPKKYLYLFVTIKFLISVLIPTIVVSEIGFRDLLIGKTELSNIEEYCVLEDEYFSEGLNRLVRNFECYGDDGYTFEFGSVDGTLISDISINSNIGNYFPPTFYVDRGSKFWGIRDNLSEKYIRLDCNEESFEKLILKETIFGREYYVTQSDDGRLNWVKLMVFENVVGDYYSWMITYTEENHLKERTQTEIYQSNCGGEGFRVDEF